MTFMGFMEVMGTSSIPLVAAFFIGLMMAISPCPLASNITAIAFISRTVASARRTLISGIAYTLGRALTYTLIASAIVYLSLSAEGIGRFLQTYGPKMIGPLLILIGLVLLEVFRLPFKTTPTWFEQLKIWLAQRGYVGSFLLGSLLALAFCPFSGVLFFGMLIPLAISTNDAILVPIVFGIATGLPVLIASVLLVLGTGALSSALQKTRTFEIWFRKGAGIVFIIIGVYYLVTMFA